MWRLVHGCKAGMIIVAANGLDCSAEQVARQSRKDFVYFKSTDGHHGKSK